MDLKLSGKTVLITGASQGIGAGLAEVFAEEGADLHLVARQTDKLSTLAERLRSQHGVAVTIQGADLSEMNAAEDISRQAGDIDILINNAGAIPSGTLWQVDARSWRRGWEVKVLGYIDMTREIYPRMKARGRGVILNNIGIGGEVFDASYIAGSSGNAALMAFTRALGGTSLDDNIRVIGINPGPVATERVEKFHRKRATELLGDENRYTELLAQQPRGRPATVREIADAFAFLASDRSAYTSGAIVTLDGGISSRKHL